MHTLKQLKKGDYFRTLDKKGKQSKETYIKGEFDRSEKKGLLVGIRQDKEKLMIAEPQINGIWTLHLNEKGYITKITLF